MKVRELFVIAALMMMAFACKKDVGPTVIVTVTDSLGMRLPMARVFTHPCFDPQKCEQGQEKVNPDFIKEVLTDASGQVAMEFPYSAIIDIKADYTPCDTPANYCPHSGLVVAKFETKKLKSGEKNEYNIDIVVLPLTP